MIKKLFLASVILSQLTISCSNNNEDEAVIAPPTAAEESLKEQIANILKQPYSKLLPAEQKVKLEIEANEMLLQMDKSKSSGAIEAIQNLKNLLTISPIDVFGGKNGNEVEDILKVADVYGIYTWNNTDKIWKRTSSTTDLKFVFPAKTNGTENNATFSAKSVSSDIKVKFTDTYGSWSYPQTGQPVYTPGVDDYFFLPTSADATLTIGGAQAATFVSGAKYSKGVNTPDEASYKMVLNDGYAFEVSGNKKATDNTGKATFSYNGKNLVEFNAGSTSDIDGLLSEEPLAQYRGKANGLVKIMDNFIIVADMDLTAEANDAKALEKSAIYPDQLNYKDPKSDYKAFYTAINTYEKKYSEGTAANFNKNMKLILVSKKDGTKIADIVMRSEKQGDDYIFNLPVWDNEYEYWTTWDEKGELFSQPYLEEVYYLKFSDNTQIAMSAYFSDGFEKLQTKFEDFLKTFTDRNN
ncbi:hypothetical protein QWY99_17295 [Flavobacterium branchiarum]|uniref:Lipoprotein n=1 Tax=Flavobacterium branchiarum TaxID=1114870 RepID=A0ABV5FMG2_9FLAO|nr:hypothetical protein [Flavobacterium branchiarum]MDN3674797.1 hypothetical protein [Flavobacterium branchiarum]